MSRSNPALLRAPTVLPEGNCLAFLGYGLRVVVACDIAEAEEGVVEAILELVSFTFLYGGYLTYNGVQLVVDYRRIRSIARPRMILLPIVAIRVRGCIRVVESAVAAFAGQGVGIFVQTRKDTTFLCIVFIDEAAVIVEAPNFLLRSRLAPVIRLEHKDMPNARKVFLCNARLRNNRRRKQNRRGEKIG